MRIKFNDKIYRLKEIESGVDSLMELVEEPKYKHGDFLMTRYKFAFIFDREGENGEAHYLFCTDMAGDIKANVQDRGKGIRYCGYLKKDAIAADHKAIRAIHDGLKSIGKRWNADKKCVEDIPKRKFKVGDVVRIKNGISSKTHNHVSCSFAEDMDKYIGQKLVVAEVLDNTLYGIIYIMTNDLYTYAEDWLEPWSDELKKGDLAIFWDHDKDDVIIRLYDKKDHRNHSDSNGIHWKNAIKFESKEQFEKVLRGEI